MAHCDLTSLTCKRTLTASRNTSLFSSSVSSSSSSTSLSSSVTVTNPTSADVVSSVTSYSASGTLNQRQTEAVTSKDGVVIVLAGPGAGKTRVISHRIQYLVHEEKVPPPAILAVTFTNRAASEMKQRVLSLLGQEGRSIWIGTFHRFCASVLRRFGPLIGIKSDFVIADASDQSSIISGLLKQLSLPSHLSDKARSLISKIKDSGQSLDDVRDPKILKAIHFDNLQPLLHLYEKAVRERNLVDFDDLLLRTAQLLRTHPTALDFYSKQFQYILVDEFQDTNSLQYEITKLLGTVHKRLTVVGDPDQSIYSWRNADSSNLSKLKKDFSTTTVATVKLEQNYRSTGSILRCAYSVISQSLDRVDKGLWTANGNGEKVTVSYVATPEQEAVTIVESILKLRQLNAHSNLEFAILYRTTSMSRVIEEQLLKAGINYSLVGGLRFYDRKEIKDVIAYLRILHNKFDTVSLQRVINVPPRGIGQKSQDVLFGLATELSMPAWELCTRIVDGSLPSSYSIRLKPALRSQLNSFVKMITGLTTLAQKETSMFTLLNALLESLNYKGYLEDHCPDDCENRWENITELLNLTASKSSAELLHPMEVDTRMASTSLGRFLEDVSLVSSSDEVSAATDNSKAVVLSTIHASKGLEWDIVYLPGMETGILPHQRSVQESEIEEERRLLYVAMTRARQQLHLLHAHRRFLSGQASSNARSPFLDCLPTVDVEYLTRTEVGAEEDSDPMEQSAYSAKSYFKRPRDSLQRFDTDLTPLAAPAFTKASTLPLQSFQDAEYSKRRKISKPPIPVQRFVSPHQATNDMTLPPVLVLDEVQDLVRGAQYASESSNESSQVPPPPVVLRQNPFLVTSATQRGKRRKETSSHSITSFFSKQVKPSK
eukprot:GILJ01014756.1.p1 GENE.GILJ01014756.1~~GILJ01014756.1.p1  ORF type:complete len:973 (+),score=130.72 GILJ01014756.1:266-2920(+)